MPIAASRGAAVGQAAVCRRERRVVLLCRVDLTLAQRLYFHRQFDMRAAAQLALHGGEPSLAGGRVVRDADGGQMVSKQGRMEEAHAKLTRMEGNAEQCDSDGQRVQESHVMCVCVCVCVFAC